MRSPGEQRLPSELAVPQLLSTWQAFVYYVQTGSYKQVWALDTGSQCFMSGLRNGHVILLNQRNDYVSIFHLTESLHLTPLAILII